ncbi:MAG: DUF2130 domain-containing protein [Patescibacteria group bacterium]
MKNTIKCKNCGSEIEISEALTHQIEEQLLASIESKHKLDLETVKKEAGESAAKSALAEFEQKLTSLQKEKEEERLRNKKLSVQIDELLTETRKLREKDEDREIEMKKKLLSEEEKIKQEVRRKTEEEHRLKDLEKDKKLTDTLKQIEDLKSKMQQGSQQSQGETLELELETKLRSEFPTDTVTEVKKGQRGADVIQTVIDKLGRSCGSIIWESKNAQWTDGWIAKLKEDQRQSKSDIAVLVSVNLPTGVETFSYKDGVWIASWKHFLPLALALRFNLVSIHHERQSAEGKDEKMKVLYNYLTGNEFKHRVEGIVEAFGNLQTELEREKRWFSVKWAKQEKEIRKVMDHTHGMYGDLQGVIGKSLPDINTLELEEGESN